MKTLLDELQSVLDVQKNIVNNSDIDEYEKIITQGFDNLEKMEMHDDIADFLFGLIIDLSNETKIDKKKVTVSINGDIKKFNINVTGKNGMESFVIQLSIDKDDSAIIERLTLHKRGDKRYFESLHLSKDLFIKKFHVSDPTVDDTNILLYEN